MKKNKEICKYKLIKIIPNSDRDLHRELDWEVYGATIEKEVELTKKELEHIIKTIDYYEDKNDKEWNTSVQIQSKIRKVLGNEK